MLVCLAVCFIFCLDCFVLTPTIFTHLLFHLLDSLINRFGLFRAHCMDTDWFIFSTYICPSIVPEWIRLFVMLLTPSEECNPFFLNKRANAPLSWHPSIRQTGVSLFSMSSKDLFAIFIHHCFKLCGLHLCFLFGQLCGT